MFAVRPLARKMRSLLKAHLETFLFELDPIQSKLTTSSSAFNSSSVNLHHLIAFLMTAAILLDSLVLWVASGFNSQLPELFHHKVYQRAFWKYSDVCYFSCMALIFAVHGRLSFRWTVPEKYRMVIHFKRSTKTNHILSNGKGKASFRFNKVQ